jgi:peptidase E
MAQATVALTSDFPSTASSELVALIRAVSPRPRVAWVPPSASVGRDKFPIAQSCFRTLGMIHIDPWEMDSPESSKPNALDRYDIVYLTGGDPILFLRNIRRTGFGERLREFLAAGPLVVGASGGAMQLAANISLVRLLSEPVTEVIATRSEFEGLGLLDYELLPHLNRHDPSFLEKVLTYSELIPHDIVAIADGAAIVLGNSESKYIGEAVRFSGGIRGPV